LRRSGENRLNLQAMATLEQKHDRMRRIFRGELPYGSGTAAEQARQFWFDELYTDVVEAAKKNSINVERPPVDLLVSLSGFSPETTLLAYELVQPTRLLVISSENTRQKINVIYEMLHGKLSPADIEPRYVNPVDPIEIYDLVKRAIYAKGPEQAPLAAIIDITGGKKVMSAGAALAASQLDLPMCYIDSDFDPEMRQARPGSERLRVLPNPTKLFGDKDMDAAHAMFKSGLYSGARARFSELTLSMSEPARAWFLRDLAGLYQAWCDLDVDALHEHAGMVRLRIVDPRSAVQSQTRVRITAQLDFVESLAAKTGTALLLNFYLLGEHYNSLDRYDFAALLYYRAVEKSLSEQLRLRYDGFDMDRPDYAKFGRPVAELEALYSAAAGKLFGSDRTSSLPWKVALVDALILLHCVDDEMLAAAQINGLSGVGHMRRLVEGRNKSVLAHGDESVTSDQCRKLQARALLNLRAFWRLHLPRQDLDDLIATLRFVDEA
jgi:CRISPR-associated protein (TIGR02710 family)